MRSSLGRCTAVRLAWAGRLTCGLLALFACSGEAEVTTLPEGAAGNLEEDPSLFVLFVVQGLSWFTDFSWFDKEMFHGTKKSLRLPTGIVGSVS